MELIIGLLLAVVVLLGLMGWRTVRQHEKGLIESLGRYTKTVEPGLRLINPLYQVLRRVDMREQVLDVPPQEVITKDNVGVNVDAVIYFQITDPFKVTYNVANFYLATVNLAQTTLRNIIGELELDESLTSRDQINAQLRTVLDEATDKWGVKVTRVELRSIEPPRDITEAMSKQMKAEREKRAAVLEAEGLRQASILKADGEKQSEVLRAEGKKQALILDAEGRAEAIRKVADAQKFETETVFGAIHEGRPTNDLLAIKYLETLAKMANGTATKIFLPLEATGVLGAIAGIGEMLKERTTPDSVQQKR